MVPAFQYYVFNHITHGNFLPTHIYNPSLIHIVTQTTLSSTRTLLLNYDANIIVNPLQATGRQFCKQKYANMKPQSE